MSINKKLLDFIDGIKSGFREIVRFYYLPFSDISIPKSEKKPAMKKIPKNRKPKDEKIKSEGIISQIIEYYGKKIYLSISITLISILIASYLIILFGISYLWLSAYIITFTLFISFYSGLNVVLQRKRSVIDGYLRFMREFLIYRKDITFKTHILESKEGSYPYYFGEELKKMKLNLNTKQSYTVLSEFFDNPKNKFPELLSLKSLSLAAISTRDDSIANALSEQLDYIGNSRTVLSSKLGFSKLFVFLAIGFIFFIQAFLVYQFSSTIGSSFSSVTNEGGFSLKINLIPTPINYFLLLYVAGISIVLLIVATDLGTYDEDKIANHVLLSLIGIIALSVILFFMHL